MNIAHFKFFYHLFLCPGAGRFVRNRRRDFRQLNVAIPHVAFFSCVCISFHACKCLFFYRHLNMLAHRNIIQNKQIAIITEQISAGLVLSNQSQSLFCSFCCLALSLQIIKSLFTRIYSSEDLSSYCSLSYFRRPTNSLKFPKTNELTKVVPRVRIELTTLRL